MLPAMSIDIRDRTLVGAQFGIGFEGQYGGVWTFAVGYPSDTSKWSSQNSARVEDLVETSMAIPVSRERDER